MPSATEYKPGGLNSLLYIAVPIAVIGVTVYVLLTQPIPKTVSPAVAIGFCALLATGMAAMAIYGLLTLFFSRLMFDDFGVTYQDVAFPTTCIPWKQITAISIEDISDKNSVNYSVVFRLADVGTFLDKLPRRTQTAIRRRQSYLPDGIRLSTGNLAITMAQLRDEFSLRTDVPVRYPGSQQPWSDPQPAVSPSPATLTIAAHTGAASLSDPPAQPAYRPDSQKVVVREAAQVFRMSAGRLGLGIVIGILLVAVGIFMVTAMSTDQKSAPLAKTLGGLVVLGSVMLTGSTIWTAFVTKLALEPEGLVYKDSSGTEMRLRWEDVSGVHVTERGQNAVNVLIVEVKDFGAFLRSLEPAPRKRMEQRRVIFGDGLPIFLQIFGLTPPALARLILHRAGLPQEDLTPHRLTP